MSAPRDFVKPDLMVYWVAGSTKIAESLPNNALLLGSFSLAGLTLPSNVPSESGNLVLYSLANNEIVDVSRPLHFAKSTN